MVRRAILVTAFLGVVFATACNKDDVPVGTAGEVTVRVFVDADGSGGYTTGDVAIPGSVTLTGAEGEPRAAVVDANGEASFADVMPGSYSATVTGTPPGGAVLATAPELIVVVPFAGGEIGAQFRYVFNPGSVSGVLYRDDNGNGVFDAGVDTPAPGMTVNLFAGQDPTQPPVAVTATSSTGQFQFGGIRPGLYTIEVKPIATIQVVGGNVSTVTVTAAATAQVPRRFTGNLLIPIAQARTAPVGSTVAFEGVASVSAGLVGTNQLYVQDAATGILVFGPPTAGIVTGDLVRIIGVTTIFSGELEVVAPGGGTLIVTKIASGLPPLPRAITVTQLLANQFLGQLVNVQGVRVVSVATTGATSYNVNFQGNTPADAFQVRVGNSTTVGIPSTFWEVGRRYDVSGLDGIFNGTVQLKPRSSADVVVGLLTLTIAEARTHPANDTVTVEGVVYAGTGTYTLLTAANLTLYMQDATGGTQVFNIPNTASYAAGDSLRVRGLVAFFNSEYEIARFTAASLPVIEKIGTGTIIPAKTVSGAQLASRTFDGQLLRLGGLQVVSVSTPNASGAYNVVTTAPDGTSVTVRIDVSSVGILNTSWVIGTKYDVMGATFNFSTNGVTFTPQIKPRSSSDVALTDVNIKTIAVARTVSNDVVTVEGVVTAGRGTFRTDNAYIQDGTGGVLIFNLPLSLALAVGDAVRVHGKMTVFSGESEIVNNIAITDSIKVTKLGAGAAPAPKILTGVQFLSRTFEGQLVTLPLVTIVSVGTAGGTGTYTVNGTAQDGSPIVIFMSAPAGTVPPPSTFTVGSRYDLTGITVPFGTPSVEELKPRGAADVVPR